jgi:predicted Kef-type K+ transport protein
VPQLYARARTELLRAIMLAPTVQQTLEALRELAAVRRIAVGAGVLQIVGTTVVGAGAALILGLDSRSAFVVGAALAISSTLLIVRLLVERFVTPTVRAEAVRPKMRPPEPGTSYSTAPVKLLTVERLIQ